MGKRLVLLESKAMVVVAMRLGTLAESHRDGRNEEVPGKERAQAQDKEADPDQVVAVGISQKVTPRTHRLPAPRQAAPSAERTTTPITLAQVAEGGD